MSRATAPTVADPARGARDPGVPAPFRVRGARREATDVWTLELEPAAADAPPRFRPGQFNMLYAWAVGEAPISISGDPSSEDALVHTIRAVGATTRALCAARHGASIGVRGPLGNGWPVREAEGQDVLLVAGGVGLAPLRPALYHILRHRARYGRVTLIYGARSPAELLFGPELTRWRGGFGVDVRVTVDHASADWAGPVGVVTPLLRSARFDADDCTALLCGPEPMMRFVGAELQRLEVPPERIHVSLERNMTCGVGLCGHCQLGPTLICRDGPIYPLSRVQSLLRVREL